MKQMKCNNTTCYEHCDSPNPDNGWVCCDMYGACSESVKSCPSRKAWVRKRKLILSLIKQIEPVVGGTQLFYTIKELKEVLK